MALGDDVLGDTPVGAIGRFKKSGSIGNSSIDFDLDDTEKKLTTVTMSNNEARTMVLELHDINGTVLNEFECLSGQTQKIDLTEQQKISYIDINVDKPDGSKKQFTQFLHRVYFR